MTDAATPGGGPLGPSDSQPAAPPSALRSPGWKAIPNFVALAILLFIAIGAVCEISNRMEEHGRLVAHSNWLRACTAETNQANGSFLFGSIFRGASEASKGAVKQGCHPVDVKKEGTIDEQISVVQIKLMDFDRLNTAGSVGDRCGIAAVIGSRVNDLQEKCREGKVEDDSRLKPVLHPSIISYSGWLLGFDERSREHLNFLLVIVSAGIGSLLAGLRTTGFTTLRDLALGLGAGYAVYLLLRGGHFAFFTTSASMDVLNPFTAGGAGLLVGLFSERVFAMLSAALGPPPPERR